MTEAAVGFQCPECVNEGRRTQRPVRTAFGGSRLGQAGYVTRTLIGLNVLGLVIGILMVGMPAVIGSGGLFTGVTKLQLLLGGLADTGTVGPDQSFPGTQPGDTFVGISQGAVYRLLTETFIHYGIVHLLLNMYALWILGRDLETALGPARFTALYLLSGLGGSVAAYLFADGIAAGASGAIFGLFAALVLVLRRLKLDTSSVIPVIVINFILTFTIPNISIAGHLGGFVAGGLVGLGLAYAPRQSRNAVQVATIAGVSLILAMLTVVGMVT
jgi:membrane associated rhomboid family serine protease